MFSSLRSRLALLWENLRSSYWFVPGLLFLAAMALANGCLWLDEHVLARDVPRFMLYRGGSDGARTILTTLGGSMISLTGVVFSLTLVALTLASGQFGPRLVRTFMQSKANQVTLGSFLSTFAYSFIVLATVIDWGDAAFVPRLSVTVGMGLGLANAALLIFFIHHVARSIQANRVVAVTAQELEESVDRLVPVDNGEPDDAAEVEWPGVGSTVAARRSGYVLSIDETEIVELAERENWRIRLLVHAGDYVNVDEPVMEVLGMPFPDERQKSELADVLSVGEQRTLVQDFEAGILHLVEVAVRALSPGINDPFTAISCLDRLGGVMRRLCSRRFAPEVVCDSKKTPRVWRDTSDFAGAMDAAFHQIRQNGARSLAVLIRMLEVLEKIAATVRTDEQRDAVARHAKLVVEAGEAGLSLESDRLELHVRWERVQALNPRR